MFCQKCGSRLPENVLFCPKCGMKVSLDMQVHQQQMNQHQMNQHQIDQQQLNQQQMRQQQVNQQQKPPEKSSKKAVVIVWIIAIIAMIIAAILLFMVFMKYRDGSAGSDAQNGNNENIIDTSADDEGGSGTEDGSGENDGNHRGEDGDSGDHSADTEPAKEIVYLTEEVISYNEDGSVSRRTVYTYDEAGYITCEYNYNGNDTSPYNVITSTYEETKDGLLCTQDYSQSGGTNKGEMLLDENGRILWSKYYNADGSCYSWNDTTYDSEGRTLKQNSYNSDGSLKQGWAYTYDQYGNMLSMIAYGESEDDIWSEDRYEYTYDDNGKLLEKRCYSDGALVGTVILNYTYYESGAVELIQNIGDDGYNNILYYDEDGNLLKDIIHDYNNDIDTMCIENTYDEYGNLLTQKCWNMSELYDWTEYSYVKVRK